MSAKNKAVILIEVSEDNVISFTTDLINSVDVIDVLLRLQGDIVVRMENEIEQLRKNQGKTTHS